MSKKDRILFVILVALVVFFVIYNLQKNRISVRQSQQLQTPKTQVREKFEKKENDEGEVVVSASPIVLEPGKSPKFDVQFNTHSVNLDFDVSQIATLKDKEGNVFDNPLWEGSPPGGHHRSGTLTFNNQLLKTEEVTLIIKDIAGIPERKLSWELDK